MAPKQYAIDSVYEHRLGKKLALIEELRAELGTEGIECPGVLVVGAQSAGKSSVLERLTGIAFPRAENTCTRVPTIVQLQTDPTVKNPSARISQHADFSKAVTCNSMQGVQDAINAISQEITTEICPIKDEPIHIQYTRSAGPVMTLIDLPGITHVDVKNEAFDIHGVTAGMVKKYVSNDNMVVLVVIPANDDFGNSEALRIAQEFDPKGVRTIGVVSKCDLVPERSDIVLKIQMTRASDVKLALGFIAVRNKGPGEDDIDIDAREESLFLSHALLSKLSKEQRGYTALTKRIVDLQSERVEKFIPEAYKMVKAKTKELHHELDQMGTAPSSTAERRAFLTNLLTTASNKIHSLIRADDIQCTSINLAARFDHHAKQFGNDIRSVLPDFFSPDYGEKLDGLMKETAGYSLPNFLNDSVFRSEVDNSLFQDVVPEATEKLIVDIQLLVQNAYHTVLVDMKWHSRFPRIVQDIESIVASELESGVKAVTQVTKAILVAEQQQIYTQNPLYLEGMRKFTDFLETVKEELTSNEDGGFDFAKKYVVPGAQSVPGTFVARWESTQASGSSYTSVDLQISIHFYVDTILKRLLDIIPMVVRQRLILETQKNFQQLIQQAYSSEESLQKLLSEPMRITETRENLGKRIKAMTNALTKLQAAE